MLLKREGFDLASDMQLPVTTEDLVDDGRFSDLVRLLLDSTSSVHLDFTAFDLEGAQRFDLRPLHILANVLLNLSDSRPLEVSLPRADTAKLLVMRSGLLFGLFNRLAGIDLSTVHSMGTDTISMTNWIELWSHPWSPLEPAVGRLFEDSPRVVDSKDFAGPSGVITNARNAKKATRVVVDPHTRSRQLLESRSSQGLAKRWLRLVTPGSRDTALSEHRETWMSIVANRVLVEPLVNLADHAIQCPPGAEPRTSVRSLALLARTDGGAGSYPRLQMFVADNGYGLVDTLRPKLQRSSDPVERATSDVPAIEVLEFAVTRPAKSAKDPGLPWARTGFEVAFDEARRGSGAMNRADEDMDLRDAEFTVITGDPSRGHCAIWVRSSRRGPIAKGELPGVPFIGTTVSSTIPMPRSNADTMPLEPVAGGATR